MAIVSSRSRRVQVRRARPTASVQVTPDTIEVGNSATVSWSVGGAQSVTLNGSPVAPSGTLTVGPSVTTAYSLIATGAGGSRTSSASLTVNSPGTYPDDVEIVTSHDTVTNFARTANILSTRTGNWSDATMWSLGRVPQAGDVVGIKTNHVVTFDLSSTAQIISVGVAGTLTFRTDINTKLTCQNLLVYGPEVLGLGNYGALRVGTAANPVNAGVTAEIVITGSALIDPNTGGVTNKEYSNGILIWGERTWRGNEITVAVQATGTISAGATTLSFVSSQTGWTTAHRLLIPDSDQILDLSSHPPWKDEVRTPSAVTATSATVSAMTHQHKRAIDYLGNVDFTPHIVNLSRNVIIRSLVPDGVRGHVQTFDRAKSDVRYVRFESMGRTKNSVLPNTTTNQKGRYADHMHHILGPGDGSQGAGGLGYDVTVDPLEFKPGDAANTRSCNGPTFRAIGNVYEDTSSSNIDRHKWPFTLHGTCDGLVKNNIVYKSTGSGMMCEDGNEVYNVFDGNTVCRVSGNGDRGDASYVDGAPGREGNGYHWPNLRNYIRNNIACNIDGNQISGPGVPFHGVGFHVYNGSAITLPNPSTGEGPSQTFPAWQGADADVDGITDTRWPVLQFQGNECYSTIFAFVSWFIGSYYGAFDAAMPESVFEFDAWHNRHAVFNFPGGNHRYFNCKWRGDWAASSGGPGSCNGFGETDYLQANLVLDSCDIQGFGAGVQVIEKSGTGDLGTTTTVTNCLLVNYNNISVRTMTAVSGSRGLSDRCYRVEDCTLIKAPLSLVSEGGTPRKHLSRGWWTMFFTPSQNNWMRLDQLFFTGCTADGAVLPDLQSFYVQQLPWAVMEQQWFSAGEIQYGGTARGRSNLVNDATQLSRKNCGEIIPQQAFIVPDFDGYMYQKVNGGLPPRMKLRGRTRNRHTTARGF